MENLLKKILIYLTFLSNLVFLSSVNIKNEPDNPLTGVWKGYLTQKEGGFASKYAFEIDFKLHNDNRITGESRLDLSDGTFGIITLIGEKIKQKIFIKEIAIKKQKIDGGSWCIKKYTLQLKNSTLKGSWAGCVANSELPEGEIYLERK